MEGLKEEIVRKLHDLGKFGNDPDGGVSRLLYSKSWVEAQNAVKAWLEKEGFEARFDEVGNLFGTLIGTKSDETILTGSHIDTVKNGGLYDGQYGIVAGIIAINYLKEKYGQPLRNLEVVSMAEEEGSRFPYTFWGSKNIVGIAKQKDVETIADFNGISFEEAMKETGFHFKDESKGMRKDVKSFVEIHVEQGSILEAEKKSVGIVQSIVGQRRFSVQLTGDSNHAGTTPMGHRRDTVYAASQMISEIITMAKEVGDPLVTTVGNIEVKPNMVNVVPGKTNFTIDVRHIDKNEIVQYTNKVKNTIATRAKEHDVEAEIDMWLDIDPVPMDAKIVKVIETVCNVNDLNYKMMHSGAGHDAQIFAPVVPTAMLFVPSHKGISHNPAEHTEPEDLAEGVKALIGTLYELAYKE
ncbi:allantoate deiminase [Alteribacillus bidgolensis]|uniref:Allantoate deiminase n=1 Tax=Alteribacillus bidgolensis TaxID=930129 RepID=A0A1G8NID3_9BACI|nr:allantoate deiminase [Alteribacillus bidgolensis]SDI79260.1 allantoate deiminase [Alteribacillus bidgolensis]